MSIQIIVEDGSGVNNANSYVTSEYFTAFAAARGAALPSDSDALAVLLIRATDYLETFAYEYIGSRFSTTQGLSWPRIEAYSGLTLVCGQNEIPNALKMAQCQCGIGIFNGFDPMANVSAEDYVIERTIGPITTKFANPVEVGISAKLSAVDSLLAPLLNSFSTAGKFSLKTVRV